MVLGLTQTPQIVPRGASERRAGDRFPIERELTYKVLNIKHGSETGCGKTVNLSSSGVLFATQAPMTPGKRLELAISWPVQLDGKCALKLVARGRVVRVRANAIAVEIDAYEFRTHGSGGLAALANLTTGTAPSA